MVTAKATRRMRIAPRGMVTPERSRHANVPGQLAEQEGWTSSDEDPVGSK